MIGLAKWIGVVAVVSLVSPASAQSVPATQPPDPKTMNATLSELLTAERNRADLATYRAIKAEQHAADLEAAKSPPPSDPPPKDTPP